MKSLLISLSLLLLAGCGTSKPYQFGNSVQAPTVLRSVNDLPKPSTTLEEIQKTGYIRVIAESAKGQSRFNAIEAAKGVAEANILHIIEGSKINYQKAIATGELKEQEVKILVSGTVRTYECGAYYDESTGTTYACMEALAR